jgi:hypothetical protein
MHKVFVYGTLKQGGYNHYLLEGAKKYSAIAPKINLHAGPFTRLPFADKDKLLANFMKSMRLR